MMSENEIDSHRNKIDENVEEGLFKNFVDTADSSSSAAAKKLQPPPQTAQGKN
jgi:hypothetical protein